MCFNSKLVRLKVSALKSIKIHQNPCFNSKLVRLKAVRRTRTGASDICFNSKLVRLKVRARSVQFPRPVCFNSKLVRLKVLRSLLALAGGRFNSKLVRLKVQNKRRQSTERKFQFQTGAIKSVVVFGVLVFVFLGFNSKLVRLKGSAHLNPARAFLHRFNSKLVRLKVQTASSNLDTSFSFQFQTGAIKSRHLIMYYALLSEKFQFQTGAIKSREHREISESVDRVSIPNWCD